MVARQLQRSCHDREGGRKKKEHARTGRRSVKRLLMDSGGGRCCDDLGWGSERWRRVLRRIG
jgi:hypothetical protein